MFRVVCGLDFVGAVMRSARSAVFDWGRVPLNTEVDRVCDVHFIEAIGRGMTEVPHCDRWDEVPHVVSHGVTVMDCPVDEGGCQCRVNVDGMRAWDEGSPCRLDYWEKN